MSLEVNTLFVLTIDVEAILGLLLLLVWVQSSRVHAVAWWATAHLMRAGIGPAMALKDLGIEVLLNKPGVGQRLMDHPSIAVASFLTPQARVNSYTRRHLLVALRYSSGIGGAPQGDMYVAVVSRSACNSS